jgi:hypothetical protein
VLRSYAGVLQSIGYKGFLVSWSLRGVPSAALRRQPRDWLSAPGSGPDQQVTRLAPLGMPSGESTDI